MKPFSLLFIHLRLLFMLYTNFSFERMFAIKALYIFRLVSNFAIIIRIVVSRYNANEVLKNSVHSIVLFILQLHSLLQTRLSLCTYPLYISYIMFIYIYILLLYIYIYTYIYIYKHLHISIHIHIDSTMHIVYT